MVDKSNVIDFSFLHNDKKIYSYTILILLNRPIFIEQYLQIMKKCNFVICADGAANRLHNHNEREQ